MRECRACRAEMALNIDPRPPRRKSRKVVEERRPETEAEVAALKGWTFASDGERDVVVRRLRDAEVEGRLTEDELEGRLAEALRARTRERLEAIVRGLPAAPVAKIPAAEVREPEPDETIAASAYWLCVFVLSVAVGYCCWLAVRPPHYPRLAINDSALMKKYPLPTLQRPKVGCAMIYTNGRLFEEWDHPLVARTGTTDGHPVFYVLTRSHTSELASLDGNETTLVTSTTCPTRKEKHARALHRSSHR